MNIGLRMILFSAVLLVVFLGIAITVDNWQFRTSSEIATGEILSMREAIGSREHQDDFIETEISHYPTVRFKNLQGNIYEVEVAQPIHDPIPDIGDRISIRYEVANPEYVRDEDGLFYDWLIGGAVTAAGLFFFLISFIFTRRKIPEI